MPSTPSLNAVHAAAARVLSGSGAVLLGADAASLDTLAEGLGGSVAVLRVAAPPAGLGLSGFMAAVTGTADLAAHDDAVLEQGFRALTAPGGVALLVEGADRLQRPVLRYIQLACRNAAGLRVVLAGTPALLAALDGPDLQTLRARVQADEPAAHGAVPAAPPAPPMPEVAPDPAPVPRVPLAPPMAGGQGRRVRGWAAAGLGAAASVALGAWITQAGSATAPLALAVLTVEVPAPAPPASVPAPEASPPGPLVDQASPPAPPTPDLAIPDLPPPALPLLAPPPPRPARTARRPEARPREAAAQPRRPGARREAADEPYALPSQPNGPYAGYAAPPPAFIGTYSVNPDGSRSFRMDR